MSKPEPGEDDSVAESMFDFLDEEAANRPARIQNRKVESGKTLPIIRKPVPVDQDFRGSTTHSAPLDDVSDTADFDFLSTDNTNLRSKAGNADDHWQTAGVHDLDSTLGVSKRSVWIGLVLLTVLVGAGGYFVQTRYQIIPGGTIFGKSVPAQVNLEEQTPLPTLEQTQLPTLADRFRQNVAEIQELIDQLELDAAEQSLASMDRTVYGYGEPEFVEQQSRIDALRVQIASGTGEAEDSITPPLIDEQRITEAERLAAEQANIQVERLADAERKAEAARLADAERKAETARLADAERKAEAARLADAERKAEAARLADAERKAEAARLADAERKAEAARLADAERKAEAARLADAERKAETARLADAERKAEAARLADAERKAETARLADAERKAEAARLADAERKAEAARLAKLAAAAVQQTVSVDTPATSSKQQIVSDADLNTVYKQFSELKNAIESMDINEVIALTRQSGARIQQFQQIFQNNRAVNAQITNVATNNAEGKIIGQLKISNLVRPDGAVIMPPTNLSSITLISVRGQNGWSAIAW